MDNSKKRSPKLSLLMRQLLCEWHLLSQKNLSRAKITSSWQGKAFLIKVRPDSSRLWMWPRLAGAGMMPEDSSSYHWQKLPQISLGEEETCMDSNHWGVWGVSWRSRGVQTCHLFSLSFGLSRSVLASSYRFTTMWLRSGTGKDDAMLFQMKELDGRLQSESPLASPTYLWADCQDEPSNCPVSVAPGRVDQTGEYGVQEGSFPRGLLTDQNTSLVPKGCETCPASACRIVLFRYFYKFC